jgi:hypothetical protein
VTRCVDAPLTATTLTLSCHKEQAQPIAADAGLHTLFENACRGLSITPEQLRQEVEADGDIPDLVPGKLTPKALRLMAKTLVLMRCSPEREWPPEICRENTDRG